MCMPIYLHSLPFRRTGGSYKLSSILLMVSMAL